jgi:hypothetical protein
MIESVMDERRGDLPLGVDVYGVPALAQAVFRALGEPFDDPTREERRIENAEHDPELTLIEELRSGPRRVTIVRAWDHKQTMESVDRTSSVTIEGACDGAASLSLTHYRAGDHLRGYRIRGEARATRALEDALLTAIDEAATREAKWTDDAVLPEGWARRAREVRLSSATIVEPWQGERTRHWAIGEGDGAPFAVECDGAVGFGAMKGDASLRAIGPLPRGPLVWEALTVVLPDAKTPFDAGAIVDAIANGPSPVVEASVRDGARVNTRMRAGSIVALVTRIPGARWRPTLTVRVHDESHETPAVFISQPGSLRATVVGDAASVQSLRARLYALFERHGAVEWNPSK